MNKDVKDKWIVALESGDYEQVQAWLRKDNAYCCLGVLCDITDPSKWQVADVADYDHTDYSFDSWQTVIPDYLREELGITVDQQTELIELNDDKGLNFKEIAAWIRENL